MLAWETRYLLSKVFSFVCFLPFLFHSLPASHTLCMILLCVNIRLWMKTYGFYGQHVLIKGVPCVSVLTFYLKIGVSWTLSSPGSLTRDLPGVLLPFPLFLMECWDYKYLSYCACSSQGFWGFGFQLSSCWQDFIYSLSFSQLPLPTPLKQSLSISG